MESSLSTRLSAPVFQAGARSFSLRDIFDAAAQRGTLADFRATWQAQRDAAAQAEAAGLQPEEAAVEAASNTFRYARDLVTAEECERWLAQRGLTFDDLTASITRRLQAELVEAEEEDEGEETAGEAELDIEESSEDQTSPHPDPLPSFRRSGEGDHVSPSEEPSPIDSFADEADFYRDALLADEFTEWARESAWRVALAVEEGAQTFLSTAGENPAQKSNWADLEDRFAAAMKKLAEPERRRRELAAQRLPLTRLTVAAAEFDSVTAAREAFLCAKEDGVSLEEIARANGFPWEKYEWLFEDFTPDWQEALLSASPGEVVPPLPKGGTSHENETTSPQPSPPSDGGEGGDGGFVVLQLLDKREPSLEDADVRERLDKNLARRCFGELEAKHIRWRLNVEVET